MHRTYHPHHDAAKRPARWLAPVPWVIAAYAATGFYSVQPNEQAVVRRCGKVLPRYQPPGLHFGFPYPIDRVDRVKVTESKRVTVGVSPSNRDPSLVSGPAPGNTQPTAVDVGLLERSLGRKIDPRQAECLTGDRNLIVVSAVVQYRVRDPGRFLFAAADVPVLISSVAAGSLSSVIASMPVDDVLTAGRIGIQDAVMDQTQQTLDRHGVGVQLTSVSLERVKAPQEVADAFRNVTAAREDRQTAINEAEGYASGLGPRARGEAQRIRLSAEAYAEKVVKKARGDAARFSKELAQLGNGRELTIKRLILETMEEVLPRLNKIIVGGEGQGAVDLGIFEDKP